MIDIGAVEVLRFWGKAEPGSTVCHPAICHMLDVGIVAGELAKVLPTQVRDRVHALFGGAGRSGLALVAALHDIGKISPGFQTKREDLCTNLRERGYDFPKHANPKHGQEAAFCLPDILQEEFGCPSDVASVLTHVLAAHHGVFIPFKPTITGGKLWGEARKAVARSLAETFRVETLEDLPIPSTPDALILGGLLTMADWLGSSEEHFPFAGRAAVDIGSYVADRTTRARELVKALRLGSSIASQKSFSDLFPFAPNPCQEAVLDVASRLGNPSLIVVESPMGTGKTEAALGAFNLLAPGHGLRGFYYALPTQATGNSMFRRVKEFLERLAFTEHAEFHLLHANADLDSAYQDLRIRHVEESEGSVVASSWFTARKRGLLAGYATGTVDQALLAVLKVRHFFLRLFGLTGKLLILDEVHAYDAYMTEEIANLVGWLPFCGSSVILLSATLPRGRRRKLLEAFSPGAEVPEQLRYPCVIGVDTFGQVASTEIQGLEPSSVALVPIICTQGDKTEAMVRLVKTTLAGGGCAACIVNTVSEAQAAYERLNAEIPDAELLLFHSRFTVERRLSIEKQIRERYGKGGSRPARGIVVATQVLEQSLDVDFDLMVSDLAPIDLLLQRAGRLHRHQLPRPELLRERVLHVLLPDVRAGKPDFGGSGYVYFPDILAKTALLFASETGYETITAELPYGVSGLIEAIYGDEDPLQSVQFQEALEKWVDERLGTVFAQQYAARDASLAEARAFLDDAQYYLASLANDNDDERAISSRLARRNVTLVMLEEGASMLVRGRDDARRLYGRSLTTDNVYLVRGFGDQPTPDDWKEVSLLRHCRPLVLRAGAADIQGRVVTYDDEFGLRILRNTEAK